MALLALTFSVSQAAPGLPPTQATAPTVEPTSSLFSVTAAGAAVPVYLARVSNMSGADRKTVSDPFPFAHTAQASFAQMDLPAGGAQISVTCHDAVQSAKLLPSSYQLKAAVSGQQITFTVNKPGQVTLEINGDWMRPLHLFVNPPETNVPGPGDPNVIYFAPGVHVIDHVEIHSGQTVYLAPGAIVYGRPTGDHPGEPIFDLQGDHITVRGRGVIDGSLCPRDTRQPLAGDEAGDLRIEGVVVRDACGFTMPVRRCDGVEIDNVKVFGWRGNSDGIDICNSRDVRVHDCFVRTFDDLVVIKTDFDQGPATNISVSRCVLWNELAHALSLGAELREPVTNVAFSDCDIIADKGREPLLRIYHCDAAPIRNVSFDHVRIEEAQYQLMSVWIGKDVWSNQPERGHVDNVTFQDITAPVSMHSVPPVELVGFDAGHLVSNVTFQNVSIGGKPLTVAQIRQNAFVRNVIVSP